MNLNSSFLISYFKRGDDDLIDAVVHFLSLIKEPVQGKAQLKDISNQYQQQLLRSCFLS